MQYLVLLTVMLFAYLLGSVCTAIFVCRAFTLADPRTSGSNNPGATNVMRIGGKVPAILTFLGDGLKGALPTYLAYYLGFSLLAVQLIMICAILGHIFPIFFRFKGGKAVATTIGSLIAFNYLIALAFIAVWLAVFLITKISSLGALVAAITLPIIGYLNYNGIVDVIPLIFIAIIMVFTHHANITRLWKGQEQKIGNE